MTALGAGFGRAGGTCGAVTGGLVAIGLLTGRDGPGESKEPAYDEARSFVAAFEERFGSTSCPAILGFDLRDPAGREAARAAGALESRCVPTVAFAAGFIEELLRRLRR